MTTFKEKLQELNACLDAVDWVGDKTLNESWATCERGDWMLWLAGKTNVDRKLVVLAACDCAELADRYLDDATRDPARNAIATARRWVAGDATPDECMRAAETAAYAAHAAHAAYAAYAAANSYAVAAVAAAADTAAHAAYAAADAAAHAAYAAAHRDETLQQCADIVRKYITAEMIAEKLK